MGEKFDALEDLQKSAVAWKAIDNWTKQSKQQDEAATYALENKDEFIYNSKESIAANPNAVLQVVEQFQRVISESLSSTNHPVKIRMSSQRAR